MTLTRLHPAPPDGADAAPSPKRRRPPALAPLRTWPTPPAVREGSSPPHLDRLPRRLVLTTMGPLAHGMANSFYTAAVKSGTESWKAAFFGSIDRASFITVDKPPAALWLQELSPSSSG